MASPSRPGSARVDIAVVGGGIAGLATGALLAGHGLQTAVIDRAAAGTATQDSYDGRTTAMTWSAIQVLAATGVWDEVAAHACPVTGMDVMDGRQRGRLAIRQEDIGDHPYGYNIENVRLRRALIDRLRALPGAELIDGTGVAGFAHDDHRGVEVALDSGRKLWAELVVGADGRGSPTRRFAGIPVRRWRYDQKAIVVTIGHSAPNHGIALEHSRPGGPFALAPMLPDSEGHYRTAVIWCERGRDADTYLAYSQAQFEGEIAGRLQGRLGDVWQWGQRFGYPISALHAQRYTGRRVALVGESAHAMHPIAAQGLNVSMRDAAVLVELAVEHSRLGLDLGNPELLRRYQQWRRLDVTGTVAQTDLFYRLFCNDVGPLKPLRSAGLAALNGLAPAKRALARDAMGLVGDVPRLARGEAL